MSRCAGSSCVTSRPSTSTCPELGSSSPATNLSSVDLPQPDAPTITSISPSASLSSTPCSTSTSPKLLRKARSSSVATLFLAFREPLHEPALHQQYDRDRGQQGQRRNRHYLIPLSQRFDPDHSHDAHDHRIQSWVGGDQQRPEILVPAVN